MHGMPIAREVIGEGAEELPPLVDARQDHDGSLRAGVREVLLRIGAAGEGPRHPVADIGVIQPPRDPVAQKSPRAEAPSVVKGVLVRRRGHP